MKCLNLLVLFTILIIKVCYSLTCEEAKNIFNIEWEGDCCDLQQFTCNETKDEILSIDIISLKEQNTENEVVKELFARSPKKSKLKSHKHHDIFDDDDDEDGDCYKSTISLEDCLNACKLNPSEDGSTSCEDSCKKTERESELCNEDSAAFTLKMNSFLWIVALTVLLKILC